jgi:hypothetical protein
MPEAWFKLGNTPRFKSSASSTPRPISIDAPGPGEHRFEAVTSHGPIDQKRKNELHALLASARPGLVFVTAFIDHKTYSKYHVAIAWETEAWVA